MLPRRKSAPESNDDAGVMDQIRFPNLFIIGAMKAGTSSLHEYLHQHPEIFMSRFKEPQYFAPHKTREGLQWGQGNPSPESGIDWYLRLFDDAGDVKYAGESSVSYTARPSHTDCEMRIHGFNPDARLIYIMRDPIERAISHYWHFVAAGREDRDMLSAFRKEPEYIARSNYAMQLRPYLDRFGRDQVFTLTLEELNADSKAAFRSLFTWLGVDPDVQIDTNEQFNVSSTHLLQTRRHLVFLDTMMRHWRWKRLERNLPRFVTNRMRSVIYRGVAKSALDSTDAVEYLRPILKQRTESLKSLIRREFPQWTTLYTS